MTVLFIAKFYHMICAMTKGAVFGIGLVTCSRWSFTTSRIPLCSIKQRSRIITNSRKRMGLFFLNNKGINFVQGRKRIQEKHLSLDHRELISKTSKKLNHLILKPVIAHNLQSRTTTRMNA
jgi:hypothetical protein